MGEPKNFEFSLRLLANFSGGLSRWKSKILRCTTDAFDCSNLWISTIAVLDFKIGLTLSSIFHACSLIAGRSSQKPCTNETKKGAITTIKPVFGTEGTPVNR
jgi:hypothetical protein